MPGHRSPWPFVGRHPQPQLHLIFFLCGQVNGHRDLLAIRVLGLWGHFHRAKITGGRNILTGFSNGCRLIRRAGLHSNQWRQQRVAHIHTRQGNRAKAVTLAAGKMQCDIRCLRRDMHRHLGLGKVSIKVTTLGRQPQKTALAGLVVVMAKALPRRQPRLLEQRLKARVLLGITGYTNINLANMQLRPFIDLDSQRVSVFLVVDLWLVITERL